MTVWARTATLGPVATLASERTKLVLRGADGAALAELVDDTVSVEGGSHNQAQFRELEVEDTGGGEPIVAAVAAVLREAGAVGGEFVPKVVRALGPQATTPADPPPPLPVDARDPVSDLVAATLRGYTRHSHGLRRRSSARPRRRGAPDAGGDPPLAQRVAQLRDAPRQGVGRRAR